MHRNVILLMFSGALLIAAPAKPVKSKTADVNASLSQATWSINCGLWRTDTGFQSTIQINNRLVTGPSTATPMLFMADGTEYDLPPITLPAAGVATVSVNSAIAAISPGALGITAHLSQFGSAAIRYQGIRTAVGAQMALVNTGLSLSYSAGFNSIATNAPTVQTMEGLWWARDNGIGGFLSLSNAISQTRTVTVQAISATGQAQAAQSFVLQPHANQMVDLLSIIGPHLNAGDAGGVRVQFTGNNGEVNVTGGLENQQEGYSAGIPFWLSHATAPMGAMNMPSSAPVTVGHPGVMVGAPDVSMGFRTGTRFLPYWALRNISGRAIVMNLFLYTNDGVALTVPAQSLQPWESRQLNMAAILQQLGLQDFNGTVTLAATHTGQASDVISAAGSADLLGTYVFPVAGRGTSIGLSKHSPYWTVKNGSNAMASLWNPSASAEDVVVTLNYALGSGVYHFRVHLAAHATASLDIQDLITDQSPDADGNVLPHAVQEGSLSFHSASGLNVPVFLNVSVGSFNVITATCEDYDIWCDGYVSGSELVLTPNPLAVSSGQSGSINVEGYYSDGEDDPDGSLTDVGDATLSSSNTGVATVSGDAVTGVSAGSATISATAELLVAGSYFGDEESDCGDVQETEEFGGSGGVTVTDPNPVITGITPAGPFSVGAPATINVTGQNFGTSQCPTLGFPFTLQNSYTISSCKDASFTVAFTPSAAGSGDLQLTKTYFGGQQFLPSPQNQAKAQISATNAVPQVTGLQQYTNTGQYIHPFAPLAGTPQTPVQYMLIYGSYISQDGTVAPQICVSGVCATNAAITVTGFHLGGSWILSLNQINIPYWVDPTATTGNYTLTLQTAGGTSSPPTTFSVLPPPAVQVTPGPETIMATTTGPDGRNPIADSIPIMANGQPSGGTFQWTTTSPLVTLTNAQSQTVTVTSVSGGYSQKAGDVAVEVVYTVGGVSSPPSTSTLTVSKPQTLVLVSDSTNNTGHSCNQGTGPFTQSQSYYTDTLIGAHYTSYVRNRLYSIQDYLGNTVSLSMNLFESYSPLENQISVGTGVGATATDYFAHCSQTCRTGGTETLTSNQSIYANNFPIAYKAVSWTCTAVTVVP